MRYWGSGNFTIEYNVDNVDEEYERLRSLKVDFVTLQLLLRLVGML